MLKDKSLAFKLVLFMSLGTALIFIAAFLYNYIVVRALLLQNTQENAKNLSLAITGKIEKTLTKVEQVPLTLASMVGEYDYSKEQIIQVTRDIIKNNKDIYGSTVALEPFTLDPASEYFAPYSYRLKGSESSLIMLGGDNYRYFQFDWYQMPKDLGKPVWTEPYFDEGGGNVVMSTFSAPISKKENGKDTFYGVVTADVYVNLLKQNVQSVKLFETGYAFLLSTNGVFVSHPNNRFVMRESIFSIAEDLNSPELRAIGREMIRGKQGFVAIKDFYTGNRSWLFYTPLKQNGWSVGIMIPEAELFADMHSLAVRLVAILLIGLVVLGLVVFVISSHITKPLTFLAKKATEISTGNLEVELPEAPSNDEIGNLTHSFKEMKSALKEYISNLAEATAAKERIESELKIAHAIQMSFLPKHFPPFPEKAEFDIYAKLEPAKEVGGDLYDFFLLGDDQLFFSIGDVSGKGVPAALFMAVTKTLIKGITEAGMAPNKILERVNAELCIENDSNMFVTMFCGILNYKTGQLAYSSAGHNPPILARHNQESTWLDVTPALVLGVFEEANYECQTIQLNSDDELLLYTDGVTEAFNLNNVMYSDMQLLGSYPRVQGQYSEVVVNGVLNSVKQFVAGAEQSDDITILSLRYLGQKANES